MDTSNKDESNIFHHYETLKYDADEKEFAHSEERSWKKKLPKMRFMFISLTFCMLLYSQFLVTTRRKLIACSNWGDVSCRKILWKGETPKNKESKLTYEVSVVISYCDEDFDVFMNYINDSEDISIRSTTIISRCPHQYPHDNLPSDVIRVQSRWIYPELNFMQYLAAEAHSFAKDILPPGFLDKNHMVLFLKADTLQNSRVRKLDDVIQSAKDDGFGCIQKAPIGLSYYHDTELLKTFSSSLTSELEPGNYNNLGGLLNHINASSIFDKELVPVCYGGSFAIQPRDHLSSRFREWYLPLKAVGIEFRNQKDLERRMLCEYIERIWASLFTPDMPEEKLESLKSTNPDKYQDFPYNGALIYKWEKYFHPIITP